MKKPLKGKRVILLTGSPGVGKTTVIAEVVRLIREAGYNVGGMISHEVRQAGIRVGFEIVDIASSKKGWLARVDQKSGPQVGKYLVNSIDLNEIGVQAILHAVEESDVIVIDEIGPMELFSEKFKDAAEMALSSTKPVIAIIHWKTSSDSEIRKRKDAETFVVTAENRNELPQTLAQAVKLLI